MAGIVWLGRLSGIDTDIAFGLRHKPERGTIVLFDHRGFAEADAMFRIVSYHWAHILGRLASYAETDKPVPYANF